MFEALSRVFCVLGFCFSLSCSCQLVLKWIQPSKTRHWLRVAKEAFSKVSHARPSAQRCVVPFVCVFNSWVIDHVFIGFKEWYFSQNETTSRPWRKVYGDEQAITNHLKLIFFSKTGNINVFWRVLISLHFNSPTRTSPSDCHMSKINGMEPSLSIICHLLSSKFKEKIRLRLPTQW